jgi:hypothetical protein
MGSRTPACLKICEDGSAFPHSAKMAAVHVADFVSAFRSESRPDYRASQNAVNAPHLFYICILCFIEFAKLRAAVSLSWNAKQRGGHHYTCLVCFTLATYVSCYNR